MHRTIRGFDGIRALAVIAVVLTHLGVYVALTDAQLLPRALLPMVQGFLITTLLINERTASGSISLRNFILRRTLRIFPLYILFLVIATLLHVFGRNVTTWDSLFYAYIYSYNFVPREFYTGFMGHTWSLAVEEHFYLVWPTVFLLLFGKRRPALVALVLSFIVTAPFVQLLLIKAGLSARYFVDRWSFVAGSSIAMGCLLALLIDSGGGTLRRRLGHPASLAIAALLYANSFYLSSDSWFVQNIGVNYLRTLGIALAIAWINFNQTSRLVALLELPPLKYIGRISYGVYMYQGLFLDTGPARDPSQSWPPDPTIGFLLVLIAAPLSYRYFEKPFLRLKSRYAAAQARATPAAAE